MQNKKHKKNLQVTQLQSNCDINEFCQQNQSILIEAAMINQMLMKCVVVIIFSIGKLLHRV